MKFGRIIVAVVVLVVCSMAKESQAQTALGKAIRLNVTGGMQHSARGSEVIYRSYGKRATRSDAMASWAGSAPHAALINGGQIHRVRCVGRVCVGRR